MQEHNAELTQNIALYQTVKGTPFPQQGVLIKTFQITSASEPQSFRYSVVLAKKSSGQELVHGAVTMVIMGKIEDKAILLPVKYVDSGREDGLAFQFRHFQELKGELGLPKNFIPEEIVLRITPDTGAAPVQQSFPWVLVG